MPLGETRICNFSSTSRSERNAWNFEAKEKLKIAVATSTSSTK
jgi:hypothetical protein